MLIMKCVILMVGVCLLFKVAIPLAFITFEHWVGFDRSEPR